MIQWLLKSLDEVHDACSMAPSECKLERPLFHADKQIFGARFREVWVGGTGYMPAPGVEKDPAFSYIVLYLSSLK